MGIEDKDDNALLADALTFCDEYLREYPSKLAPFWARWFYRWNGTYMALSTVDEDINADYDGYVKLLKSYSSQPRWVRWQDKRLIDAMRRYCLIVELRRDIIACQGSLTSVTQSPNGAAVATETTHVKVLSFHAIASLTLSSQRAMGAWGGWFNRKRKTLGRLFSWANQTREKKVTEMNRDNQETEHNELINTVTTWQQTLLKYGQQDGITIPSLEKQANDKGWITPKACANAREAAWQKAFARDKRYLGRGARKGSFFLGGNREETALYYRSLWFALSSFRTSLSLSDSSKTEATFLDLVRLLREGKALFEPASKLGKQFETIAAEITRLASQRELYWRTDKPDESLEWDYADKDHEMQNWIARVDTLKSRSRDWQDTDETIRVLFRKLDALPKSLAYLSTQGTTVEPANGKQIYDELSSAVVELENQWTTWEACQATQAHWRKRLDANWNLNENWKNFFPEDALYFSTADAATLQGKLQTIEEALVELNGLVKIPPRYHTDNQAQAIEEKFSALRALQEDYVNFYYKKQMPILQIKMQQCTALSRFDNTDFDELLQLIDSVTDESYKKSNARLYEALFTRLKQHKVSGEYAHQTSKLAQDEIHALRFFLSTKSPRLANLLLDTPELLEAKRHLRVLGFHYREAALEETGGLTCLTLFLSQYHVEEAFTVESLKAAHIKLSQVYHPDKAGTVPDCVVLAWPENRAFDLNDRNLFDQPSFAKPVAFICKGEVVYYAIKALSLVLPIGFYEDVIREHGSLKVYHKAHYATTCTQAINAAKSYIETHQAVPGLRIPFDGEKTPLRENLSVKRKQRPVYSVGEEDRVERAQEAALETYKEFVSLLAASRELTETRTNFEAYKAKRERELTEKRRELTEERRKLAEKRRELTETRTELSAMAERLSMLERLILSSQHVSIGIETASALPTRDVTNEGKPMAATVLGSHGSTMFGGRSREDLPVGLDAALVEPAQPTEEENVYGHRG